MTKPEPYNNLHIATFENKNKNKNSNFSLILKIIFGVFFKIKKFQNLIWSNKNQQTDTTSPCSADFCQRGLKRKVIFKTFIFLLLPCHFWQIVLAFLGFIFISEGLFFFPLILELQIWVNWHVLNVGLANAVTKSIFYKRCDKNKRNHRKLELYILIEGQKHLPLFDIFLERPAIYLV